MAIPNYQACMLPLLNLCKDSREHSMTELTDLLAKHFDLSERECAALLTSGKQAIFDNRIGWARTYLKKAGLLNSPKRGVISITETGKKLLAENPERIDVKILNKFESFLEFRKINARDPMAPLDLEPNQLQTPQELLESVHQQLRAELADDLLRRIKEAPPILAGHHAKKGVFITTSRFADNAREYAATVEAKVILIDGQELAQLGVFYATPRLGHFYKVFL